MSHDGMPGTKQSTVYWAYRIIAHHVKHVRPITLRVLVRRPMCNISRPNLNKLDYVSITVLTYISSSIRKYILKCLTILLYLHCSVNV